MEMKIKDGKVLLEPSIRQMESGDFGINFPNECITFEWIRCVDANRNIFWITFIIVFEFVSPLLGYSEAGMYLSSNSI